GAAGPTNLGKPSCPRRLLQHLVRRGSLGGGPTTPNRTSTGKVAPATPHRLPGRATTASLDDTALRGCLPPASPRRHSRSGRRSPAAPRTGLPAAGPPDRPTGSRRSPVRPTPPLPRSAAGGRPLGT